MRILVIDDDKESAFILTSILTPEHTVEFGETPEEAIALASKFKPQLIISDWNLKGDRDGVEVCQEILEEFQIPVIFVSGSPIQQLKEVAKALKPLHVLQKPLDLDHLSELIAELHEQFKKQNEGNPS